MAEIDRGGRAVFDELARRVRVLETRSPLGDTTVSKGALTIASNEGLLVNGSAKVDGWLVVSGTERVTGLLEILGELRGSGPFNWAGPFASSGSFLILGPTTISGTLDVSGLATLRNTLRVLSGGSIQIDGAIPMALGITSSGVPGLQFSNGGHFAGTGSGVQLTNPSGNGFVFANSGNVGMSRGSQSIVVDTGGVTATALSASSLTVSGAKSFGIPHPTKPGKMLKHGSTESPVSGIEYWGESTVGQSGSRVVHLPDYFEALAKPENRTVFVTGRGFAADWTDIESGRFSVSGPPGKRFSWLVKAERFGGDFEIESPMPEPVMLDDPESHVVGPELIIPEGIN